MGPASRIACPATIPAAATTVANEATNDDTISIVHPRLVHAWYQRGVLARVFRVVAPRHLFSGEGGACARSDLMTHPPVPPQTSVSGAFGEGLPGQCPRQCVHRQGPSRDINHL